MSSDLGTLQRIVGHGDPSKRNHLDHYPTPDWATDALLDRVSFEGGVWEPCCGDGRMADRIKARGYQVCSSDIADYGYGEVADFLCQNRNVENVVTNPPFKLGTAITLHALKVATKKVAIFNKLTFLEGKERKAKLYSQGLLSKVLVFSTRVSFGEKGKGGILAFAWYIFDHSNIYPPTIEWI